MIQERAVKPTTAPTIQTLQVSVYGPRYVKRWKQQNSGSS